MLASDLQKELRERPTVVPHQGAFHERTATVEDSGEHEGLAPPEDQVGVDDDQQQGFGIGVATTKPLEDDAGDSAQQGGDGTMRILMIFALTTSCNV